jgi:alkylhydroperoxidase family enzyme
LGDRALVQAVLEDHTTAPISDQEHALFRFIAKVIYESNQVDQADVDAAKATGWSDEALYDAITVCALFQFYNTWIDATGVHDMPAFAYDMSGKRLATMGYAVLPPDEQ